MEYFFETAVKCRSEKQGESTHLAIINNGNIRYLVSNRKGLRNQARKALANNISSYSKKLCLLMRMLEFIPDCVLKFAHLGKTVSLELPTEVVNALFEVTEARWPNKKWDYNIIVGSYVEKQKIVIQCFTTNPADSAIYFKICSDNARTEIENETNYLKSPIQSELFQNPRLCYSKLQKDGAKYNIQVTEEFSGSKVAPKMTSEIYQLFKQISASKVFETEDGKKMSFSHGDFAPWNLKHTENGYIIFDWEYCGMRFYGFDLIHYLWQIENKINKKNIRESTIGAVKKAQEIDSILAQIDAEVLGNMYLDELKIAFGDVL